MLNSILPFIVLILVVVFIHEYGHYYFAKKYGVKVTDFSIGFGKELFGWNDKLGTRWKICWIPLGGYVKFFGDRNVKEKISRELSSYKNKPNKEKKILLVIINSKNITIASKNAKGKAQTNRIVVNVNVKIILAENNIVVKNFSKSSIYDVIDRKSEQKLIENKLIENLSGEIALQIIFEILKNTK